MFGNVHAPVDVEPTVLTAVESRPAAHLRPVPCSSTPPPQLRVMVVDDSSVLRAAVSALIAEICAAEITEAEDAYTALDLVDHVRPDVVVLDLRMPGMDGLALARQLRDVLPDARLVLYTADACSELDRSARAAGVDQVVAKGTTPDVLIDAVRASA